MNVLMMEALVSLVDEGAPKGVFGGIINNRRTGRGEAKVITWARSTITILAIMLFIEFKSFNGAIFTLV